MAKNSKTFSISADGIERIKTISSVTNSSYIKRELFVKEKDEGMFLRTSLIDVPDDFIMPVYDLRSFISTYKMFEDSSIDYSDMDEKKYIKIINNKLSDKGKKKEFFIFRIHESIKMENDLDITKGGKIKEKMGEKVNSFTLTKENIKTISKSCAIIDANQILISTTPENTINIKLINTKVANANSFEMEIDNNLKITVPNLFFKLHSEHFSKLESGVDEYNVKFNYTEVLKNESPMCVFENSDSGLCFFFGRMTKG